MRRSIIAVLLVVYVLMPSFVSAASNLGAKFEPPGGKVIHGLGQYSPEYSEADNWKYVTEYQNATGKIPAIYSIYTFLDPDADSMDPTADGLNKNIDQYFQYIGSDILLVGIGLMDFDVNNLEPNQIPPIDANKILSGQWDAQIKSLAQKIKSIGTPTFVRPGWEFGIGFHGNWNPIDIGKGLTAEQFKEIWIHIYTIFQQENVNNVAWVWNAWNPQQFSYMDWYPGDQYVDWWGINYFNVTDINAAGNDAFLEMALNHSKPVMICESNPANGEGNGATLAASWEEWYIPYFNKIAEYPHIKGFIYVSDPWEIGLVSYWPDSRINTTTTDSSLLNNFVNEINNNPKYIHNDDYLNFPDVISDGQCSDSHIWTVDATIDDCGTYMFDEGTPQTITVEENGGETYAVSGYITGMANMHYYKKVTITSGSYTNWAYSRASYNITETSSGKIYSGTAYFITDNQGKTFGACTGDIHGTFGGDITGPNYFYITSINGCKVSGNMNFQLAGSAPFETTITGLLTDIIVGGGWHAAGLGSSIQYNGPFDNLHLHNVYIPSQAPDMGFAIGEYTIDAPITTGRYYLYNYAGGNWVASIASGQYIGMAEGPNTNYTCSTGNPVEPALNEVVVNNAYVPASPTSITVGTYTDTPDNLSAPINVTFREGTTTGGTVTAVVNEASPASSSYKFNDYVYDISTMASFSGNVEICLPYKDDYLSANEENNLKLLHWDQTLNGGLGDWADITSPSGLDTASNMICGIATSFSPFAVGAPDTDGDGMPDAWESTYGLDPNDPGDAALLSDSDTLTNLDEFMNRTDPTDPDTDGDGMTDGWEVLYSLNPLVNDASADLDGDGITNLAEFTGGSNPTVKEASPGTSTKVPVHNGLWLIPSMLTGLYLLRRRKKLSA